MLLGHPGRRALEGGSAEHVSALIPDGCLTSLTPTVLVNCWLRTPISLAQAAV
jgi:hypothetical protein